MTAYVVTLYLHSYLRWGVLALLVLVFARSWAGWFGSRGWTRFDEIAHVALLKTAYVQFLFGLILYIFLSPYTAAFLANIGAGMQQSALRFFGMLHIGAMFAAVGILQQGRRISLLAKTDRSRYLRVAVTTSCALIVVCAAIPWPIFEYGRPLLRLPSFTATYADRILPINLAVAPPRPLRFVQPSRFTPGPSQPIPSRARRP